jgi:hypothetical protein
MDFPMDPRIPALLQPLLQEYICLLERDTPGLVSAFYLVGSIALDAFNPRHSDVDFVAVLNRRADTGDQEQLLRVHRLVERKYPKWKMEGAYFQPDDLGRADDQVAPFLKYHDGKMEWCERFGLSSVTWWILKGQGIRVFGPPSQTLAITLDVDDLLRGQMENLNSYWAGWTRRPGRLAALLSDWGVQWTVLGVLRQFYTLHEQRIISKTQAGEYALACLPERWRRIVGEAIALRESSSRTYYLFRITRAVEAYNFLKYIIQSCNDDYVEAANL